MKLVTNTGKAFEYQHEGRFLIVPAGVSEQPDDLAQRLFMRRGDVVKEGGIRPEQVVDEPEPVVEPVETVAEPTVEAALVNEVPINEVPPKKKRGRKKKVKDPEPPESEGDKA